MLTGGAAPHTAVHQAASARGRFGSGFDFPGAGGEGGEVMQWVSNVCVCVCVSCMYRCLCWLLLINVYH